MIKGIDVSHWNEAIDWAAAAADGVRFAMLKAGNGKSVGGFTKDAWFLRYLRGCEAAGIAVGAYLYSYARSSAAAAAEADGLVTFLEPYRDMIRWPVAYDIEEQYQAALGRDVCTAMCRAFCERIRAAGYTPMVYANANWLTNYLRAPELGADVWLAHYTETGGKTWYTGAWAMHQYSETGRVAGIAGAVDMDVSRVDFGADPVTETPQPDVPPDAAASWAAEAWAAAYEKGIMDGTRPTDNLTRQELSVILRRVGLI